jgi:hypothetical protein
MMRKHVATLAIVGLLAIVAADRYALAQDTDDNLRRSMGNKRPTAPATQSPNRTTLVVPQPHYGGYGHRYYRRYRPYYPHGYGYYPPPYPYYYRRPYVYPPIYVPPETMYGPRALRRFMGTGW